MAKGERVVRGKVPMRRVGLELAVVVLESDILLGKGVTDE